MSLLLDALKQAEVAKSQTGTKTDGDRREPHMDRGASDGPPTLDTLTFSPDVPLDAPTAGQQPLPEALDPGRGKADRRDAAAAAQRRPGQRQAAQLFAVKRDGRTRADNLRLGLYGLAAVLGLTVGGMYLRDWLMPPVPIRPLAPLSLGHAPAKTVDGMEPAAAPAPTATVGPAAATVAATKPDGPIAPAPTVADATAKPQPPVPVVPAGSGTPPPQAPAQATSAVPSPPGRAAAAGGGDAGGNRGGATAGSAATADTVKPVPATAVAATAATALAGAGTAPRAAAAPMPGATSNPPPVADNRPAAAARPAAPAAAAALEPLDDPLPPVKPLPVRTPGSKAVVPPVRPPGSLSGPPRRLPMVSPAKGTVIALGEENTIKVRPETGPAAPDPAVMDGYAALLQGDYPTAKRHYDQALASDPLNVDAVLGLATVAAATGDRAVALRYYRRALELDPNNATALAGMAATKGAGGQSGDESGLRSELAQRPDPALHFALGNEYAAQSRWAEAQQSYFDAFRLDSANPDYAYNLAVALDQLDKTEPALNYYRKAEELSRGRTAHFDRAALRTRIGQLER
jgi:tetratricopeptide (TPR) repeat protein